MAARQGLSAGYQGEHSESAEVGEGFGQISVIRLLVMNSVTQQFGSADKWIQDLERPKLLVARDRVRLRKRQGDLFEYSNTESSGL